MILVIVESPSKAKHIQEILGSKYTVRATKGHIRSLKDHSLSVDLKDFSPIYSNIESKADVIKELTNLSSTADRVLLATDGDREGEAIAWHLKEVLNLQKDKYARVVFHEITEKGVKKGIKSERDIDYSMVKAQEARKVMDRLIGFGISPKLYSMFNSKESESAGRVQTVCLKLVSDRTKQFKDFKSETFNSIKCTLTLNNVDIETDLKARIVGNVPTDLTKLKEYSDILDDVKKADIFTVVRADSKDVSVKPNPPFTTSTYQQVVCSKLGISSDKAMEIAQKLFTNGYITYLRTDSVVIDKNEDIVKEADDYITKTYGVDYAKDNNFKDKKGVQQGHGPIRPTSLTLDISKLGEQEQKVYNLIKNRFLLSRMSPAVKSVQSVLINSNNSYSFLYSANSIKFPGYKKMSGVEAQDGTFIDINKGDKLSLKEVKVNTWDTKPLPLYTESSIVKEMDTLGIGRPATFAITVKTLKDRGYISNDDANIVSTKHGDEVSEYLTSNYSLLFNTKYTSNMEQYLDDIASGKSSYDSVVKNLYGALRSYGVNFMSDGKYESMKDIKPSERQRAYIKGLADKFKVDVPDLGNFKEWRAFLDVYSSKSVSVSSMHV